MKLSQILLLLISLIIYSACSGQENKSPKQEFTDWKKNPDAYAKQIIPKKIEYGIYDELTPIQLKRAVVSKVDARAMVLAICSVRLKNDKESALTCFLIDPLTNKSKQIQLLTVKGCDLDIPVFIFRDINHDGKDEFIFIDSNNSHCEGQYWISPSIVEIGPGTSKNGLDQYLKLKNNMTLNRKVKDIDQVALQKALEDAVSAL